MTAPAASVKAHTQRGWTLFLFTGVALGLSLWAFGFSRSADAAKTTLWWFTLGTCALALSSARNPRLAGWVWLALTTCFAIDGATQGVIRGFFGVSPQPSVIAEALANTNSAESLGFVYEQRHAILKSVVFTLFFTALAWMSRTLWCSSPARRYRPSTRWAIGALLAFTVLLHFNKTMLTQQPMLRWFAVYYLHAQAHTEIAGFEHEREKLWTQHEQWGVKLLDPQPRTVVMFIGESANASNWQLLGYPRDTTGPLREAFARLPGDFSLYARARSPKAFTLPSLKLALTPATSQTPDIWNQTPDITFLAKAAGYHVTWLSNQPSNEGWFSAIARNADTKIFINNGNWRDSSAVDSDLAAPLSQRLNQTAPDHELIVIHLLGQHFHYAQRCPPDIAPFKGIDNDSVMQAMKAAGRSASTRQSRNDYDNAVYCGSQAVAQLLDTLYQARQQRAISAFYFSDHGQEVGHNRDFSGHSEDEESGHTIPAWTWTYRPGQGQKPLQINSQPYSLDAADQTMQTLLHIRSRWTP
jgi:heptose-I-phosphate ethanolaminephosphotransferase